MKTTEMAGTTATLKPQAAHRPDLQGSLASRASKAFLLLMTAAFLTITTFVFGAMPMRVLRSAYGRLPYWCVMLAGSALMAEFVAPSYGLLMLALTIAVGIYTEIEEHGDPVFWSGFGATLAAVGISVVATALWIARTKTHLIDELRQEITPLVDKLTSMNGGTELGPNFTVDALIQQLPSGFVIGVIVALAIALLTENRWRVWLGLGVHTKPMPSALAGFRVPDVFIWVTIVAVFGAFFHHHIAWLETASVNTLNILVVAFFFQGLAVASQAFRTFKIAPFWRALWYLILVLQLFLLVSLVGFADFWLDFRERLTRKPAEPKKIF